MNCPITAKLQILADEIDPRVLFEKIPIGLQIGSSHIGAEFPWSYHIESAVAAMRRAKMSKRPRRFRLICTNQTLDLWGKVILAQRKEGKFFLQFVILKHECRTKRKSGV